MNGIVSYGAYVPSHKIETGEIASVWGADGSAWAKNLNVYSKSVPGPDEDVITIANIINTPVIECIPKILNVNYYVLKKKECSQLLCSREWG